MARTNLTVNSLSADASVAQPAGNAVDVANGHAVPAPTSRRSNLLLDVDYTFAGSKNLTIRKGTQPGAAAGDLVIPINAARRIVGPLSTDRFMQDNGEIWVDHETGATGTVRAYRVQRP